MKLSLITEGDLIVKILNRGFRSVNQPQDGPSSSEAAAAREKKKPLWPAKTKIFVEQALREQENPRGNQHLST